MKSGLRILRTFRLILVLGLLSPFLRQCHPSSPENLVDIPDSSFLNGLMAAGVDRNGDGQITYTEAEATRSIVLPPSGISDLTGLEAFIHLDSFVITLNPLRQMDLSANTSLRYFSCTSCELTELDVSDNLALEHLICGRNMLMELDVGQNISLVSLVCNNNLLTCLDPFEKFGRTIGFVLQLWWPYPVFSELLNPSPLQS